MKQFFCAICLFLSAVSVSQAGETKLKNWTLQCEGQEKSYKAMVPATVAGVLADNGFFGEDFFNGDNYFKIDRSVFDKAWTFSADFKAERSSGKYYTLRFEGLDYYADIFLNGSLIAASDTTFGVFKRRSFDVTGLIRGENELKVTLHRANPGDLNVGYVDWNPRPLDESLGIVRDVILCETGAVSIDDLFVKPELNTETLAEADLNVSVLVSNHSSKKVTTTVLGNSEAGKFSIKVTLAPYERKEVSKTLRVDKPRVWWSHDLGSPELYEMEAKAMTGRSVSDSKKLTFGIRSITSRFYDEKYRQFILNGQPVLIKGAGWTDEIFMRDTHESIAEQIQLVKDMGLNCIRFENIWGKDSFVYDECDREGILVLAGWSCQWEWEDYCGLKQTPGFGCINDSASMDLAVRYFHDQVLWMRGHPSLIAWITGSDRIPNPTLEQRYDEIYKRYEYRPYVCSAKGLKSEYGGLSGLKMEGPYEYVSPEYWYIDTKRGGAYGFNSETGIGANIPQAESLKRMMPNDSLWPISASWSQHCTASTSAMNTPAVLVSEVNNQYGEASTLESFLSRAHSVDYDGTRAMFEAFRCNAPKATGIIQWMLNSAWPSLYWQLYDYYMIPTAGYYGVKKACAPAQLIYNYGDGKVYGINDYESGNFTAKMFVYDVNSVLAGKDSVDVKLANESAVVFDSLPKIEGGFLALKLYSENGTLIEDNFYCLPVTPSVFNWNKANWCNTPSLKSRNLTFVTNLPAVNLIVETESVEDGYQVKLTNPSDVISYSNRLALLSKDGALLTPAFWSENFVTVLPGETKIIHCKTENKGEVKLFSWI